MDPRKNAFLLCLPILVLGFAAKQAPQSQSKSPQGQGNAPAAASSPNQPRFEFGGNAAEEPATFIENLVFLPVNVNQGKPSLFVLDTGVSATSIDPGRAAEIGVSANQRVALILPGVMFPFDSLPAVARAELASETGRPYEGTIGGDLLSRVVVETDYSRQTVRAFDPGIYKYTGRGKVFGLTLSNGMPVIRAKMVTPRGKQVEADFGLDTALIASIVVSEKFSDTHKVFPKHGKAAQGYDPQLAGGESVSLFRLRDFEIAHWIAPDSIAELSRSKLAGTDDPKLAGVIGSAMLRRFNIVLDYPHQQIIFEANTHLKDYDEEDKSGMAVIASGPGLKTFEIVHVVPGSPAAAAGIHAGDIIAGVNDEAAADIPLASLRDMFRQVGHTYKILIQRGDQTKQVSIQMRRLL
jgi:membrane-associated protease RseP (regulator of RpoE activity)